MRRPVVLAALASAAMLLGACRRDRKPPPVTATAPDPQLQTAFGDIFRGATAAATKARELHENDRLSATRVIPTDD